MTPEQYHQAVADAQELVKEFDDRMLTLQAQVEYRLQIMRSEVKDLEELVFVEHWIDRNHKWVLAHAEQYNKAKHLLSVPEDRILEIINQIKTLKES